MYTPVRTGVYVAKDSQSTLSSALQIISRSDQLHLTDRIPSLRLPVCVITFKTITELLLARAHVLEIEFGRVCCELGACELFDSVKLASDCLGAVFREYLVHALSASVAMDTSIPIHEIKSKDTLPYVTLRHVNVFVEWRGPPPHRSTSSRLQG